MGLCSIHGRAHMGWTSFMLSWQKGLHSHPLSPLQATGSIAGSTIHLLLMSSGNPLLDAPFGPWNTINLLSCCVSSVYHRPGPLQRLATPLITCNTLQSLSLCPGTKLSLHIQGLQCLIKFREDWHLSPAVWTAYLRFCHQPTLEISGDSERTWLNSLNPTKKLRALGKDLVKLHRPFVLHLESRKTSFFFFWGFALCY